MADKVRQVSSDVLQVASGGAIAVKSGGRIDEEAGGAILGRAVLNAYHADIGTAGSTYVVCPFDGDGRRPRGGEHRRQRRHEERAHRQDRRRTVTHPAWEVAITATAGTRSGVVPTAANTAVKAGQVIEVASDGGSSAVTPAMYSIVVRGVLTVAGTLEEGPLQARLAATATSATSSRRPA
jgi:hypothetical protein